MTDPLPTIVQQAINADQLLNPNSAIPATGLLSGNVQKWAVAKANVRSGTKHAHLACIGTSKTWGYPNAFGTTKSYPSILRTMLNNYHIPAAEGWVLFSAHNGIDSVADSRLTTSAGWSWGSATMGPATQGVLMWTSGTTGISFTPGYQFDTIKLLYTTFTNKGSVTVNVDGGATLATVNMNGAAGVATSAAITTTLATHVINISAPTGGDAAIWGILAYDSTRKSVLVSNWGVDGSTSANWISNNNPYEGLSIWGALQPDLSIILLDTNDAGTPVTSTTLSNNLQTLITTAGQYGSVILGMETPDNNSHALYPVYEPIYLPVLQQLAITNGIPFIDLYSRWITQTNGTALGFIEADKVHPTTLGAADIAAAMYQLLTYLR